MRPLPPVSQLVLRALVLLGPVVALLAAGPAGHWPSPFVVVVVVALAAGAAVRPDSALGACVLLVVLVWWAVALKSGTPPEVVVAAVAMVVAHVAALLASYGPVSMPVDAATLRTWVRRGVLVLLPVPLVWATAELVRGEREQSGIWILGVLGVLALTVTASVLLRPTDAATSR